MASTAKVVSALAALEMVEAGEASLDDEVVVSEEAAFYAQQIYSNVGLVAGDSLSVRELLYASLVASGDDAVQALAEGLGGGSAERFVDRMNAEAREAGLRDSNFENPTGLDEAGQRASARDLAMATRAAYEHDLFGEIVATPYATVTTQDREIYLENTNELLFTYPEAIGVKTGTTPAAGASLISAARDGDESYVAVVLDAVAEDRFAASVRALEYGFEAYDRKDLVREGERYAGVAVPYRRGQEVALLAQEDVRGLVGGGREAEMRAEVPEEPPAEARRGQVLGEVVAYVDGERVGASPLVAARGYEEASLWERLWYTTGGLLD
jgi:D-alanyl-D-alanine carboxypeptidase (penicillin-binding protein 5/6)